MFIRYSISINLLERFRRHPFELSSLHCSGNMEFTVSQLTSRLLDKLNRNSDRFTPPDLARAGFPERLIDLIVRAGEAGWRECLVEHVSKWRDQASEGV